MSAREQLLHFSIATTSYVHSVAPSRFHLQILGFKFKFRGACSGAAELAGVAGERIQRMQWKYGMADV